MSNDCCDPLLSLLGLRADWSDSVIKHIRHLAQAYSTECCGLVYVTSDGPDIIPIHNVADDPYTTFVMDSDQQAHHMSRYGRMPDAIYHTHPGGTFDLSPMDRSSLPPYNVDLLLGVPDGRVGVWRQHRLAQVWDVPPEPSNQHRVSVVFESRDRWLGWYLGDNYHYICLMPCVAIRIRRSKKSRVNQGVGQWKTSN